MKACSTELQYFCTILFIITFEINIFFNNNNNNRIIESFLTHICQGSPGSIGPPGMAAVVPPAPLPRQFHPGMCAHLLED